MLRWVIPNTLITKEHHTSCDLALIINGHHHCLSLLTNGNIVADLTLITNVHQHVVAAIELYCTFFNIFFILKIASA